MNNPLSIHFITIDYTTPIIADTRFNHLVKLIKYLCIVIAGLFFMFPSGVNAQSTIPVRGVYETTFTYSTSGLTNPWETANGPYITAVFTTPSGKSLTIDGFYYDVNTYKIRFTPTEVGNYTYRVYLDNGPEGRKEYTGSFTSTETAAKGFVRRSSVNPYRFVFEDGSYFNGIGLNDCWYSATNQTGYIDRGVNVPVDTYMQTYATAGFNLFRWNQANCGFGIFNTYNISGNTYRLAEGKMADQLLSAAKKYKFHTLFTFWWGPPYTDATNPDQVAMMKRAFRYVLARYGAYIDIWELANESSLSLAFIDYYSTYLRTIDPYQRLVTNSWPVTSDWNYLDFRSPHGNIYDAVTMLNNATANLNIPAMVGEAYQGTGLSCNYNSLTPQNFRVTTWTSIMSGFGLIWWSTTGTSTYCPSSSPPNIYIGTEERSYARIAQDTLTGIDANPQFQKLPSSLSSGNDAITVYGLFSSQKTVIYFFKKIGYANAVSTTTTFTVPYAGTARWLNPKTGTTISTMNVSSGNQNFTTPNLTEDLALIIVPGATTTPTITPPTPGPKPGDANGDGQVNESDYTIWLSNYNQPRQGSSYGDFNSDAKVDGRDYVIWLTNYGN